MSSGWHTQMSSALSIVVAIVSVFVMGIAAAAQPADVGAPASLEEIRYWNRVGRSADAERAARVSLKEAERVLGPESTAAAEILDELAVALRRGGKGAEPEALEVCQRAVRINKQAVGGKDRRYATSLYNLGLLYLVRRELKQALSVLKETLEIRKLALNRNHPDVAKSLLALGSVQHDLGNYAEGLALTEQAVEIEEITLGKANPERAYGLNALAVAHYSTGDFSGAIPLFEEAIDLWERSDTPNPQVMALCYHNLGAVCDEMGDHERAIGLLERALRLREEQFGMSHPLVA
ncbi:MAG: tetratricopeptide repeat protein, partial [Acidobacteria bacterium]